VVVHRGVLTPREWATVVCIASGMTRQQAADVMGVKISTVTTHMKRAASKWGCSQEAIRLTEEAEFQCAVIMPVQERELPIALSEPWEFPLGPEYEDWLDH